MKGPKESPGKETEVKAGSSAVQTGSTAADLKFCHGSVCVGNQKPTNCICPTDKK